VAAGTAALLAAAGVLIGRWLFDLTPQTQSMAYLFCISIASGIVGTPTAILRMFERYSAFVIQAAAASAVKIAVVVAAYVMQVGLWGFALSWVVVQVFSNALLVLLAFAELKKQAYGPIRHYSARDALTSYPDVIGFFITTNLNGMARVLRDLDVPLVGLVLGPVAAGTFKLARQFAGALNKLIDPFFQAIYPDLARLHAQNDTKAAMSLVRRSSAMLGACGIVVLVAFLAVGRFCVELVLGPTYGAVFPVAAWCVAASVVWAFAQPLSPMLMVLGRHRILLASNIVTSAAYLGAVALVSHLFGAVGAGAAFFGFLTVWAATAAWLLVTASRRGSSQEPRPASPYEGVGTSTTTGQEVVVKR
jgi:O-antigen/teichoic acid export membrane protein